MKASVKTIGIYVSGILCLLIGVIGLVLPILQGVLFIIIGLSILSLRWPWLAHKRDSFLVRYPLIGRQYAYVRVKAVRFSERVRRTLSYQ